MIDKKEIKHRVCKFMKDYKVEKISIQVHTDMAHYFDWCKKPIEIIKDNSIDIDGFILIPEYKLKLN